MFKMFRSCRQRQINTFRIVLLFFIFVIIASYLNLYFLLFHWKKEKFNYFQEIESRRNVGLLVDLPNCKILNLSAWDKSIVHMFRTLHKPRCYYFSNNKHWTYVHKTDLIVNQTAIIEDGFTLDDLSCCYFTIHRVEMTQDKYTNQADNLTRYSEVCYPIKSLVIPMTEEFIQVFCNQSKNLLEVEYKQFHMLVQLRKNAKTREKIEFWANRGDHIERPPNVLLIGMDSVSRLSSIRNMPRTRKILKELGGIEYLGYTIVGTNTFPNAVGFLSGYSTADLKKICLFKKWTLHDHCPYIFKEFDKAHYLTGIIEDFAEWSMFHHKKTGFVQQPVDYYNRNLQLEMGKYFRNRSNFDCNGYEEIEHTHLNYIRDLIEESGKLGVPVFLMSWETGFAHNSISGAQLADDLYLDFLKWLKLNNTVLIFLSDHGYRYGGIRNTFPGWLEEKLPHFWFLLSPDLKQRYPQWSTNLEKNSKKLTTPYDLHATLSEILDITSNHPVFNALLPTGQMYPRTRGLSLISRDISQVRKCSDAGIPSGHCACTIPQQVSLYDQNLRLAALNVIQHLNSILPQGICAKLWLNSIDSGALIEDGYVVGFSVQPGGGQFEANVQYTKANSTFSINSQIVRTNKINSDVSCIKDAVKELYCFCLK